MEKQELFNLLKNKLDISAYEKMALEDGSVIPQLLEIIETDRTAVKFSAEKVIRAFSEHQPSRLYPYFERMAQQLESKNNFIKWGFIISLPNLLEVDEKNKWAVVFPRFLKLLESDAIVTFNNAVGGVWKILTKYPEYEKEVVPRLLTVDRHTFIYKGEISPECNNVARREILACFERIFPDSAYQKEILAFARANLDNPRKQVRFGAARLLKKYGGG